MFADHLPCTRNCYECFTCLISFHQNNYMMSILRVKIKKFMQLKYLPTVVELVSDDTGNEIKMIFDP